MTIPAEKVLYAAKVLSDWVSGVNPGEAADALDQLATRCKRPDGSLQMNNRPIYFGSGISDFIQVAVDGTMLFGVGGATRFSLTGGNFGPVGVNTFDGRDVSVDGATLDALIASFASGKILVGSGAGAYAAKGQLICLTFGYPNASSGNSHLIYPTYAAFSDDTNKRGYYIPWSGVIVAVGFTCDINAYTSGTIRGDVYQGTGAGMSVVHSETIASPSVANGFQEITTGLSYSLSAGDYLICARQLVSAVGITTDDPHMQVWIRVDAP